MSEENQGIASHIKFAPLILERKTPAEELREIAKVAHYSTTGSIIDQMVDLAARLEAPDEPKRWDGVFPWVAQTVFPRDCRVYFAERLSMFCDMEEEQVVLCETHQNKNQSPYHDGVIITITAGSGYEAVKVIRGNLSHALYLSLGEWCVRIRGVGVGEVKRNENMLWSPLPPGTVTRITINHTLPTTEQRYSVDTIQPEPPPFTPVTPFAGTTIKVCGDSVHEVEVMYGVRVLSSHKARDLGNALIAAANYIEKKE